MTPASIVMTAWQRSWGIGACASSAPPTPSPTASVRAPRLRRIAARVTLFPFCRTQEAADELRVLLAGARLDAGGDIDDGRAGGANGLGDVVGREPARK